MGDFQQYFDIILFAMVAAFLVLRLRSVLGRRTGNERQRPSFLRRADAISDKVVTLADRTKIAPPPPGPDPVSEPADIAGLPPVVAAGLAQIRAADPGFDPAHFVDGARVAFEMIVGAFADADKTRLRPLLSDEVFNPFAAAIDQRIAAHETLETRVLRTRAADIVEAAVDGKRARVTLKLVSEQIQITRAQDGSIVEGDPDHPIEKTDYWTFARETRSSDPNWLLVATSSG